MKIKYDPSADAATIYLYGENETPAFGFSYGCDATQVKGQIHLDFDIDNRLIRIEILQASKKLPASLLSQAQTLKPPKKGGQDARTIDDIVDLLQKSAPDASTQKKA